MLHVTLIEHCHIMSHLPYWCPVIQGPMLLSQINPEGVRPFFLCKNFLLFQHFWIAAGHKSEKNHLSEMKRVSSL